jgi:hypothetical protein
MSVSQCQKAAGVAIALSLTKFLKEEGEADWYPFVAPNALMDKMVNIASEGTWAMEGDFSKFDGTITEALRTHVDLKILDRLFGDYIKEVNEYLRINQCQKVTIRDVYGQVLLICNTYFATLTGEGGTSVFHSLRTKYLHYATFRGLGCEPVPAFKKPGVYGGDDSITFFDKDRITANME